MNAPNLLRLLIAVAMSALAGGASARDKPVALIELVFLAGGATPADRDAYLEKTLPIASVHGVTHLVSLDPVVVMAGPKGLARIDLWSMPDARTLAGWNGDPDFEVLKGETAQIHDISKQTRYLGEEVMTPIIEPGFFYLEIFSFSRTGFDREAFAAYLEEVDALAAGYGMARMAVFSALERVEGNGPAVGWMNLYAVPGPASFQALGADTRFRALDEVRRRLFDMRRSLLAVVEAK